MACARVDAVIERNDRQGGGRSFFCFFIDGIAFFDTLEALDGVINGESMLVAPNDRLRSSFWKRVGLKWRPPSEASFNGWRLITRRVRDSAFEPLKNDAVIKINAVRHSLLRFFPVKLSLNGRH